MALLKCCVLSCGELLPPRPSHALHFLVPFPCALAPHTGPGTSKIPLRCITATVLCRLVILPLLGTALVMGPYKAGWLGDMHPMALIGEHGAGVE